MRNKFGFLIESESTQQLKPLNILLIGESCQDEYHYGECNRISPEAPVPIMDYSWGSVCPGILSLMMFSFVCGRARGRVGSGVWK